MKYKKGFSIVELMLAVVLLSILFLGVIRFFNNTFKTWYDSSYQIDIQQKGRAAVDEMSRFIRQSSAPASGITPLVGNTASKISFVFLDDAGDKNMKYYRGDKTTKAEDNNGSALFRVVDGVTTTVVTDKISSLYFVHESSYVVSISSFTLVNKNQNINFDKKIYMRNR